MSTAKWLFAALGLLLAPSAFAKTYQLDFEVDITSHFSSSLGGDVLGFSPFSVMLSALLDDTATNYSLDTSQGRREAMNYPHAPVISPLTDTLPWYSGSVPRTYDFQSAHVNTFQGPISSSTHLFFIQGLDRRDGEDSWTYSLQVDTFTQAFPGTDPYPHLRYVFLSGSPVQFIEYTQRRDTTSGYLYDNVGYLGTGKLVGLAEYTAPVPEPNSSVLLTVGVAAVIFALRGSTRANMTPNRSLQRSRNSGVAAAASR